MLRFAHRIRASKSWRRANKQVRAGSVAIAAVLGGVAGTALFTSTPWAHGSLQVVIWIAAAVAIVLCLAALAIGPGETTAPPASEIEPPVPEPAEVVPIPGGPGSEGYMSASDEAVERARKKAHESSSPAVPNTQTGSGPGS